MTDKPRLIEVAFPLKQASIDSVHEKNVRHGHISTLHIWPARWPLAACRAALIATLLPDPGDDKKREEILKKLGGEVVKVVKKKKMPSGKVEEIVKEETVGGVLHWGRENSPDMDWFREEIKKAYGGRAPKVLDPFAGGGAIPLEAMRLGCEVTAIDINPVAWFILKCTLEYPQKLAGQKRPLPDFVLKNRDFMESFFKAKGFKGAALRSQLEKLGLGLDDEPDLKLDIEPFTLEADLAWHVRAWGWWVLQQAKKDLEKYYPVIDGKPTVAYLWARAVTCKNCRATIPLLKTRWLCKKDNKRVLLTMEPHPPSPSPQSGEGVAEPGVRLEVRCEVPPYIYELCRKLRAAQTPTESILWQALRNRRLGGLKFRRQHPLGRYIADFYCAEKGFVIEIDGLIHKNSEQADYDKIRDEELQSRDLRVLRFTVDEIESNLDQVLAKIVVPHPPSPSPHSGEGVQGVRSSGEGVAELGVRFGIQDDVPKKSGAAATREYDKKIGAGTMSRPGATCPCCGTIMTMEDIRLEGRAGRLGQTMTAVVVDGDKGKEYRLPTDDEIEAASISDETIQQLFNQIPFGLPDEPLPSKEALGFRVPLYGFDKWYKLFTPRQLLALGTLVRMVGLITQVMIELKYPLSWIEAITSYLACVVGKVADYNSAFVAWQPVGEKGSNTFQRWALPIKWDFVENSVLFSDSGGWLAVTNWIAEPIGKALYEATRNAPPPSVKVKSAIQPGHDQMDILVTDPPYYDVIPYSDLMDFFYIWLRRLLYGLSQETDSFFADKLSPKWDHSRNDGELIDDSSRFDGDKTKSKAVYEDGMYRAFHACHSSLSPEGRLVIVFAHKQPDAWETLVSAVIRAGFVVDGSWPIQTEMGNRTRALISSALSSSVWLVCKKRQDTAQAGWDNQVIKEMQENIAARLRDFWDAGIRGPDFVWAATGPALEAYSKHPVVKKADEPGALLTVPEFLRHVRRIVVDFVVGRVLSGDGDTELVKELDDITTYYLLHRNDFGLEDAPSGASILYQISCGLSDKQLVNQYDILTYSDKKAVSTEYDDELEEGSEEEEEGSRSTVRLKSWKTRKKKSMGYDVGGHPAPLIDQVHRIMLLWKEGDVAKVDEYMNARGLRESKLFHQLLQALIELADEASEERSLMESISNHLAAIGVRHGQLELLQGE